MSVKRVTPDEAAGLLQQGWTYVDVRSVPEFEQGHPEGAYNVPFLHKGPTGMTPNERFSQVMQAHFATDHKLVVGCRTGARSLRAAEQLLALGYEQVVDMRGGFSGERDPTGQVTCPGWEASSLPVSSSAAPGHSYAELEKEG